MAEKLLRDAAEERDFHFGAAVDTAALRGNPDYQQALQHFNMVTAENVHKWSRIRPSRHEFDFAEADLMVEFAREHDMAVRGHTLCWHRQVPDWLTPWSYTPSQLRNILREHVHTVAGRYSADVVAWDVVNEAVADDGTMRESFWYDKLGEEYLDLAFEWANEVAPNTDLYYNDYGADAVNEKSDAIYDLLERMLDRGVPVDGVGLQLHAAGEWPDPESIGRNIERFRDLGLEVQITEMDVVYPRDEEPENPLEKQADYYREVTETALDAGANAIVVWGVDDGHSWMRQWGSFAEEMTDDPLLFDDSYNKKPAYDAVTEALAER